MSHQTEMKEIIFAHRTKFPVLYYGEVNIVTLGNGVKYDTAGKDALFVQDLTTIKLFVSQLTKNGNCVILKELYGLTPCYQCYDN